MPGVVRPQSTWMVLTGRPGVVERSIGDGAAPAATRWAPIAAIIAPLSPHSFGRGTRSSMPASAQRSAARPEMRESDSRQRLVRHRRR